MGSIEIDYIEELQNTTVAETRLYFVPRAHAQDDALSLHIHELRSSSLDTLHILPSNINVIQLSVHQVTMSLYHLTNIMYFVNVFTVNAVQTVNYN